jgi:ribosomal protein S18 acetylase RimI-like enzyme
MTSLSALDQERFGVVTARASAVGAGSLPAVLAFCWEHHVQFLIARCDAGDLTAAQAIEDAGGRLMDTLVYYTRVLVEGDLPGHNCKVPIRPLRQDDIAGVGAVASEAFKGYYGHYHADPRLDRVQCDEAYQSWAHRSCVSRDVAEEVLVADDGAIAGFATLRMNDPSEGEGVLFGVAPRAQGVGIYKALMVEGMRWAKASGAERMVVSTQITNLAVQKVWSRLGFEPSSAQYTFHAWLDAK